MRFISVTDFRTKSAEIWRQLAEERLMVVTSNGKPVAILSAVTEESLEYSLAAIRSARAVVADDLVDDTGSDDLERNRTRTVVKLFEIGASFVARSAARRLLQGIDRFREVIVDFHGVDGVGQGFADEIFRVYAAAHPEMQFTPINMNEPVSFMVGRALRKGGEKQVK